MKRCFVFCHGFGFDRNFWNNLTPLFNKEPCFFFDLGYFGDNERVPLIENDSMVIGIGHSLGFIKLLERKEKFSCLVGLNAFLNFLGNDLNLRKKRSLELESMRASFLKYPSLTLKRFYKRCQGPNQEENLSKLRKEEVEKDFSNFFKTFCIKRDLPVLLLGSKDDPIVPPQVIEDNFSSYSNVDVQLLNQGKHALGFLEPVEVYKRIKSFLHAVYQKKDSK